MVALHLFTGSSKTILEGKNTRRLKIVHPVILVDPNLNCVVFCVVLHVGIKW